MARSPRLTRDWKRGDIYHVYQRGNRRQTVFPNHASYLSYLRRFFLLALRHKVRVHAFCLMPNHIHFVLEITRKAGLSDFMRDLQSGHARWLHARLGTDGHAWKHHFGCKRITGSAHYRTVIWYVEYNPVRAALVRRAEQWLFSSAAAHAANGPVTLRLKHKGPALTIDLWWKRWRSEFAGVSWTAWLHNPALEDLRQRISECEDILGADRPLIGLTPAPARPTPRRTRRPATMAAPHPTPAHSPPLRA